MMSWLGIVRLTSIRPSFAKVFILRLIATMVADLLLSDSGGLRRARCGSFENNCIFAGVGAPPVETMNIV